MLGRRIWGFGDELTGYFGVSFAGIVGLAAPVRV